MNEPEYTLTEVATMFANIFDYPCELNDYDEKSCKSEFCDENCRKNPSNIECWKNAILNNWMN